MRTIALRYGLNMAAGFIIYFLAMHLFNLSHIYYYRIYNAVIQLACIIMALMAYKELCTDEFGQFTGVSLGIITSIIGVSSFAIFQFLFLSISPEFMAEIKQAVPSISHNLESNLIAINTTDSGMELLDRIANYLTPFSTAFLVLLEGMIAGLVLSYLVVRVLLIRK